MCQAICWELHMDYYIVNPKTNKSQKNNNKRNLCKGK